MFCWFIVKNMRKCIALQDLRYLLDLHISWLYVCYWWKETNSRRTSASLLLQNMTSSVVGKKIPPSWNFCSTQFVLMGVLNLKCSFTVYILSLFELQLSVLLGRFSICSSGIGFVWARSFQVDSSIYQWRPFQHHIEFVDAGWHKSSVSGLPVKTILDILI